MDFYLSALLPGLAFVSLGFGIYISMRIFHVPDITTDGSFTLGGAVTAVMIMSDFNPWTALLFSFAGGMMSGCITGFIHARMQVNPLLAGILVMTALYSVNLVVMGRSNIPLIERETLFSLIPAGTEWSRQFILLIAIVLLLWIFLSWLLRTDFGLAMRATGNNEVMARSVGISTDAMKIMGLGLANGFNALSGCFIVQYQGFADISMGVGVVILGLGSVMIGEVLSGIFPVRKIFIQLGGVILGSIVFRMVLAFALSLGIDPHWLKLVTALFVLGVVALPNIRRSVS